MSNEIELKTCKRCGGSGEISLPVHSDPEGPYEPANCPVCDGAGAVEAPLQILLGGGLVGQPPDPLKPVSAGTSEREAFEVMRRAEILARNPGVIAGWAEGFFKGFSESSGEYPNTETQCAWEGWQMRAKASLSAEQVTAINLAIEVLDDLDFHTTAPVLRSLLPPNPKAKETL